VPEAHLILDENGCALSEPACDVVFRPLVGGSGKDLFRLIKLNELAQQEKPGEFRHARGLLHIMRDDHDSELFFQLEDQFLDLAG
jgi:hypothetical protein